MALEPTHKTLLRRELEAVDGILGVHEQHEHGTLCKTSSAERWERPRADNPYFNDKKQVKRAKQYARRVQSVFHDTRQQFLVAYKEQNTAGFRELFGFPAKDRRQSLNPLQAAAGAPTLHKEADTVAEWEEIVSLSTADLDDQLHGALMLNVTDELSHVVKEVSSAVIRVHALQTTFQGTFVPRESLQFFDAYELALSQRTKERVDGRLKDIIRDGLAQGWSNQRIRDQILTHFDQLESREAFAIARTETIRASAEGSKIAYVGVGIQMVDVLPALDACPVCVEIAKKNPYKVTDTRAYAPFHPSCRCAVVPIVNGRSVFDPDKYPDVFLTEGGNPTFRSDSRGEPREPIARATQNGIRLSDGSVMRTFDGFNYHATTHEALERIKMTGIQPRVSAHDPEGTSRVYLAPHPSVATAAASEHASTVLLRARNRDVQDLGPRPDPHLPHGTSAYIRRPIPPEALEWFDESSGAWKRLIP